MAKKTMPLVMFFVFWVAFTFLAIKGPSELKKEMEDSDNDGNKKESEDRLIAMAWACLCAIIATIPVIYCFVPRLYKKVLAKDVHEFPWHIEAKNDGGEGTTVVEVIKAPEGGDDGEVIKAAEGGESKEPPNDVEMTKPGDAEAKDKEGKPCQKTARAHGAERFDERTEGLVSFLQVVTACSDSFAHGANDTANAIGPFAALWSLYRHGEMTDDIPFWIMLVGGAGLVVGLSIWGQIIIKALGTELCLITPSRGFAIKVSSSFMIIIMSILDIPSSTTHCQVGATVAVALLEGRKEAINLPMILKVCFGWVLTLVIAALTSGIIYLILAAIVC